MIASLTARPTIIQSILTEPNIHLALADRAVLVAHAFFFDQIALQTDEFPAGSGATGHRSTLALAGGRM
jgi:hypothetical protein